MYGNDEKARWRDELWRVAANNSVKNGWVITLAGARFLDRKAAQKVGFDRRKVVGVDENEIVEKHNTQFGRTVIGLPLDEVVGHWSKNRPVSVLNADYCSNCSSKDITAMIFCWLGNEAFRDSLLCLTVSVGREQPSEANTLRLMAEENDVEMSFWNRAAYAVLDKVSLLAAAPDASMRRWASGIVWTSSYRAHRMRMDSCMVRHPGNLLDLSDISASYSRAKAGVGADAGLYALSPKNKSRIAAKLAWHTTRMGDTAH